MLNFRKSKPVDSPEEHHAVLGNGIIEISFHHATKTVFYLDQAGTSDAALTDLLEHYKEQGWFLHAVSVSQNVIQEERIK